MTLPQPAAWLGDDTFGPRLPNHRDLTLAFENVALAIVPAAVMLLLTPLCLWRALRDRGPATIFWTLYWEIGLVSSGFAMDLLASDTWAVAPYVPPYASEAEIMMCLAAVAVGVVLATSRLRGHSPALPSVYAATTAAFDLVRMRSYTLRNMRSMATVCLVTAMFKVLFITLGQVSARLQDRPALLRSQSVFDWVVLTLSLGFRNKVHLEDLPELESKFSTEILQAEFQVKWAQERIYPRWPLVKACYKTLRRESIDLLPSRLAYFGFTFSQPFLIQHVTLLAQRGQPPPDMIGIVMILTAFIFLGIGISKGYYRQVCHRTSAMLRAILVSAIFAQTMKMDSDALGKKEASKLMDTDVLAIEEIPAQLYDLCISFFEVSLGTFLLYKYVGLWCGLVLIPGALVASVTAKMAYAKAAAKEAWTDTMERRAAVASNAMTQLKGIKAMGLSNPVSTHLQELHAEEVEHSLYERKLCVATHVMDVFAESVTPTLVLIGSVSWLALPTSHTACEVFTIMSLVYLVSYAMATLLTEVPRLAMTAACFDRIQRFLLREPIIGLLPEFTHRKKEAVEIGEIYPSRWFLPALENATVLHPTNPTPILRDVSIRFAPGGVTVIHGPTGCGKSSLMMILLGEKRINNGVITRPPGPAAYCDETPWLVGKDVRENIVGPREYVEEWYKRINWACLIDDAEDLQADNNATGTTLGNCVGCQRRVQLARAMYGKPNLLVLDDPFRDVHDEITLTILDRLFGPGGVMRLLGITTVISTSSRSHLAVGDVVYAMDGEGHVEPLERPARTVSATRPKSSDQPRALYEYEPAARHTDKPGTSDTTKYMKHDFWLYWFLASSAGWKITLLSLVLLTWTAISKRLAPVYMRLWLSTEPGNKWCFVGYAIVTICPTILTVMSVGLFYLKFAPALSRNLHRTLAKTVFGSSLSHLSKTSSSQLINFFNRDMLMLSQDLPRSLLEVVYLTTLVLCDLFILLSCDGGIIPMVALFPTGVLYIRHHYLSIYVQAQSLAQKAAAPLLAHFECAAKGVIHIRAMRWEPVFQKDCAKLIDASLRPHYAVSCLQRWLHLFIDLFVAVVAISCVGTALCFADKGSETALGLAMLTLVSFGSIICRLFDEWKNLQASLVPLNRLKLLTETVRARRNSVSQGPQRREYENWRTRTGRVDAYAVTAGFDGFHTGSDAVRSVTLQLRNVSKLAIIGAPGSGKSALLLSLLGLLDCTGNIYIDGAKLELIPPEVLRTNVITLPQGGVELPGSIRRNLDPWATPQHSFNDADIYTALDRVGLFELVRSRGGLSADFASARLSKGEKQLLFLTRAILRKDHLHSRLVFVDDITSGVDDETADRIQEIIETAFADCTVVMITSHKGSLRKMQRILEMGDGRIINTIDRRLPGQQDPGIRYPREIEF